MIALRAQPRSIFVEADSEVTFSGGPSCWSGIRAAPEQLQELALSIGSFAPHPIRRMQEPTPPSVLRRLFRKQGQTIVDHQAVVGLAVDAEAAPGRHRFGAQ